LYERNDFLNAEIQRHAAKCERYRQKIAEFQALLEDAERKKTEAENAYIVSKVRSSGYTADELMQAVLLLKSGNEAASNKNETEDDAFES
jgi:pyridoxine/pyridoxamine 5'-phosphate oxidase